MSNELLEKVIQTSDIGAAPQGGGLLNNAQTNRFIDYMFDETTLGKLVRTHRLRSNEDEIDKIHIGRRLVRKATEGVDTGVNQGVTFSKVSVTTVKVRLDWELTTESLEDNLEGEALEDHIARLMAAQMANDLEDVAINGDTASADPALKSFDGWRKRLTNAAGTYGGGAVVLDNQGATISRATFNRALKNMDRKYMQRRGNLRFLVDSALIQDYLFSVQQVSTDFVTPEALAQAGLENRVRTEGAAGAVYGAPFGVPLQEVPLFEAYDANGASSGVQDGGDLWLIDPQNLIWGVKREITVYREFKPKKDAIEYTVYARVGTAVENGEAAVVVKNIAYAE
jgi:hypothetical protein